MNGHFTDKTTQILGENRSEFLLKTMYRKKVSYVIKTLVVIREDK